MVNRLYYLITLKTDTMIALIVLVVIICWIFLFKRFLDRHGKFIPSSLLMMFLKQIKDIEDSGNGEVVIKESGDFHVITLIDDGKVIDAISVDMVGDRIYSGVVKDNKPSPGDLLIPIRIPFYSNGNDELIELEDRLIDEVMEVIVKYKK